MNQQSNTFIRTIICNIVLATQLIFINQAHSAGPVGKIDDVDFSFEGVFGTYDKKQLQRGLQVFTEVCAGCHGLKHTLLIVILVIRVDLSYLRSKSKPTLLSLTSMTPILTTIEVRYHLITLVDRW